MLSLQSQTRNKEEKAEMLREQGLVPGILYGPKTKSTSVKVDGKELAKIYGEAGESSLVNLQSQEGIAPVLIREIQKEPIRGAIIHVDFYQPPLDEEIEVNVPLVFEGEAPAVHVLGGTLVKGLQEVEVKALPQNLPHEIVVDISKLETFEDRILVKDLVRASNVEILNDEEDLVAQATEAEDVEAQLEEAVQENVEAVEQVKEEKKEKAEGEESKEESAS